MMQLWRADIRERARDAAHRSRRRGGLTVQAPLCGDGRWNSACIGPRITLGVTREGLTMRAALFQMTSAVLLCLPMMAMVDAQTSSATQAAKPEQTVTTIV